MRQVFGKKPINWLDLISTRRYIDALKARSGNLTLVETRQGGSNAGTWVHEKFIIKLAQWLDVDFEVLCDDRIADLIKGANNLLEGRKEDAVISLEAHTKRPIQVANAKDANRFSYAQGGIDGL